jgi:gamma-glutamyltranspeptidase/glutathione hydrolase
MAATSQPLATQVAIDILKQGGNAIDAAIAANAMLGLVEPTGSGIGGDLFAIVWDAKTKRLYGLNASGRSPASLTLGHFQELGVTQIPPYGPLPVTVPGAIDGWFELQGKFGNLPMTDILAPTIRYAREGFPVSEVIAAAWRGDVPVLQEWAGFKETFMPNGRAPEKGEIFKNPYLANTLERIANGARDVFYKTGWSRSRRTIGATTSGSYHRTARESRHFRFSTSWKATTFGAWVSGARSTSTISSKPKSSRSRTVPGSTRIQTSTRSPSRS